MSIDPEYEKEQIYKVLRYVLKKKKKTYDDIATATGRTTKVIKNKMSKSYSKYELTLPEMIKTLKMMDMTMDDLFELVSRQRATVKELSEAQEQEIIDDKAMLLWVVCLTAGMPEKYILRKYCFDTEKKKNAHITILQNLEKLGIIDRNVGANDQIKTTIKPDFKWRSDGPIKNFFLSNVAKEYFEKSEFNHVDEEVMCLNFFVSEAWNAYAQRKLRELAKELNSRAIRDQRDVNSSSMRFNTVVIALRPYESSLFDEFRRKENNQST